MISTEVTDDIKRGRNQLAVTVVLGHTVKHIYNSGLQSVILAVIKDDLGLSGTQFGLLATSQRVTSGTTTMVAGYLGDRFANKSGLMLMLSLGIMGVSYYLLGSAPSYWVLFAVMLLVGIGPSLYHPPAIASLSRKFPDRRGFAISLHGTGGSVGEVVGPVLTGGLVSGTYLVAFHWRDVLHVSVFPALFFAVAVYLMMRNIPAAGADTSSLREYGSSLVSLLRRRAMLSLVFVTALRSAGQYAVMGFLPVYLLEDLEYEKVVIGLFMSSAQVTGIVAQPLMGYLSDRFGRKIVLVPCTLVMGLLIMSLKFAEPGPQLFIVVLAMGAFLYSLHTIYIAGAMDVAQGQAQSTVVSLIYGASFIGAFSPWVAGWVADQWGNSSSFIYGGALVILGALILWITRLPKTANQMSAESKG
jgi:MFS family permease